MTSIGKFISCLVIGGVIAAGFYYADKQGYERGVEAGHLDLLDQNSILADQKVEAERKLHSCIELYWDALDTVAIKNDMMGYEPEYPSVEEVHEAIRVHSNLE